MDFLRALRLNNEGAKLLLNNNDQEALIKLTSSLTQVQTALRGVPGTPPSVMRNAPGLLHSETVPLIGLHDDRCFVYNSVLVFPQEIQLAPQNEHNIHVYSAAIILNLALCYHRRGLAGGRVSLLKAEKMYEMIGSLLANSQANEGTELLVKIAAVNNLSHLKFYQGEFAASCEGFYFLGSLLRATADIPTQTRCQEDVYAGLFLNASFLVVPPDTAPAA